MQCTLRTGLNCTALTIAKDFLVAMGVSILLHLLLCQFVRLIGQAIIRRGLANVQQPLQPRLATVATDVRVQIHLLLRANYVLYSNEMIGQTNNATKDCILSSC